MPHAFAYEHLIATTQDWPSPGVLFRDISPLLAQRFPETIEALAHVISPHGIDAFAGVDARGFIFASALAQKFGKNLVMIRKGGKLPPPSLQESCTLEYGTATFELKPAVPIEQSCHPREGGDPSCSITNADQWIPASAGMTPGISGKDNKSRAPRIIILDDVLATGGTLRAAADLCARAGYDVVGLATLINLAFLNDFEWNGLKVNAVVRYE